MTILRDASAPKAPPRDSKGRPLPNDVQSEKLVLAYVLHNGHLAPVRDLLIASDFFAPMHGEIWTVAHDLDSRGTDPSLHVVAAELRAQGRLQDEMIALLKQLEVIGGSGERGLVDLARRVALLGLRRRAIGEIHHAAEHGNVPVRDDRAWLENTAAALVRIATEARDITAYALDAAHDGARATVARAHGDPGTILEPGISTGYNQLDELLGGGLHRGEMSVLTGPTGRGKSAFALSVAVNVARVLGMGVLYLQLEDSAEALAMRAACSTELVDSRKLRTGTADIDERARFEQAGEWMRKAPLQIVEDHDIDAIGVTGSVARARIALQERRADLRLVVVDYLQLVNGKKLVREKDNREQEVSAVARAMVQLALRERVAVLLLSQLNSDGEIRESKGVLHHAPNWLDLQLVGRKTTPQGEPVPMRMKIRKQRHGPFPVDVPLWFHPQFTRFSEGA